MNHRITRIVLTISITSLIGALAWAQHNQMGAQASDKAAPEPPQCEAMAQQMKQMSQMMSRMDEQLSAKLETMNEATGDARIEAMADVINELVSQRMRMHEKMPQMRRRMMSHMAAHMQMALDEDEQKTMMDCPAMKNMMDSKSMDDMPGHMYRGRGNSKNDHREPGQRGRNSDNRDDDG